MPIFQTGLDPNFADTGFRPIQNSITGSSTITARTIALGAPVILETATASLPSTAASGQNFVNKPATYTNIVNNLFVGVIARVPNSAAYLDGEALGLAQCYGYYPSAVVRRDTAGASVGSLLVPNSEPSLIAVGGPVTAAATGTAGHVEVPALGGLAVLMAAIATSAATETTTAPVFLRAM